MDVHNSTVESPSMAAAPHASDGTYLALGFAMATISVLGLTLNIVILLTLCKSTKFSGSTYALFQAVAWFDLICCVAGAVMPTISALCRRWVFGVTGYIGYGFVMAWSGFTIIHLLTCISIDRYISIVRPSIKRALPASFGRMMVTSSALLGLVLASLPLFGFNSYRLEGLQISSSLNWTAPDVVDKIYVCLILIIYYVLPVTIMITCYSKIYLKVVSMNKKTSDGKNQRFARRNRKREIRLARCGIRVVATFLIVWSPYACLSLLSMVRGGSMVSPLLGTISGVIAKSSILLNGCVYVLSAPKFRQAIVDLILRRELDGNPSVRENRMDTKNATIAPCGKPQIDKSYLTIAPDIYREGSLSFFEAPGDCKKDTIVMMNARARAYTS